MTHVTCRLTAKNRDQLRNRTLGNRVRATFFLVPAANRPLCMHKKLALQRVRGASATGFAGFEDFNNFLYFDLCQLLSARLNSLSYRIVSYRIESYRVVDRGYAVAQPADRPM